MKWYRRGFVPILSCTNERFRNNSPIPTFLGSRGDQHPAQTHGRLPGLKSRFDKFIHFDDYSAREMARIFEYMLDEGCSAWCAAKWKAESQGVYTSPGLLPKFPLWGSQCRRVE